LNAGWSTRLRLATKRLMTRSKVPGVGADRWQNPRMVANRADRRNARKQRAIELFGPQADAALDALELLELAWHDCYGEPTPSEQIIEDIWVVADGDLARLVSAAHLAVTDFRDLRLTADDRRAHG
jgi:hypothetical protein